MDAATSRRTPLLHRVARALAVSGVRGGEAYWRAVEKVQPLLSGAATPVAPGVLLPVDTDDWISLSAYRGLYERPELAVVRRLVVPGALVVDVGANRGLYTALLSTLVGPEGTVVAVEPSARCLPALRALLHTERLGNVALHEVALAAQAGEATLHGVDRPENSGLATLRDIEAGDVGVVVRTERLADLPEVAGTRPVGFLKVDVEGFEPDVLAGGWELFDAGRVDAALIEITPSVSDVSPLSRKLDELEAYDAFRVSEGGLLLRRPRLVPLEPSRLAADSRQYNLLVVHRRARHRVADLVAPAPA